MCGVGHAYWIVEKPYVSCKRNVVCAVIMPHAVYERAPNSSVHATSFSDSMYNGVMNFLHVNGFRARSSIVCAVPISTRCLAVNREISFVCPQYGSRGLSSGAYLSDWSGCEPLPVMERKVSGTSRMIDVRINEDRIARNQKTERKPR